MINNSALSSSMNVADIAPKAATQQPDARKGDNAFGEALAGAHTVHDRRESQEAANVRRDRPQGERSSERTRGQDRPNEARSDATTRIERTDRSNEGTDTTAKAATSSSDSTASTDTNATTTSTTDESTDATATTIETDIDATDATDDAATMATVAVAAAPVVTDLDAIIVPTSTTVTQVATDAVDAAIRLAIDVDATATTDAATTTTMVSAATTATAAAGTDVELDADLQLAGAANAPGAEDAEAGDVQGPTRPVTSAPTTPSGPSPTQLAAATFTDGADAATVASAQSTQQVATGDVVEVASGTTTDAAATQLVQAAAVEIDTDADAEVVVTDDAGALAKAAKADAAKGTADAGPELVVDGDDPDVAQAARLNQGQSPTVAFNAQVQAKAAEQAADDSSSDAASGSAKVDPLPTQAAPIATAVRGEGTTAALRMREGLQAQVQQRIDHIAEQLATRLKLSQAAGGSHVQLSLKPRELGEVTVHMNVRDGAVAATILVDKADTLRTLQTNIEDLKKSLEQQGLTIQEFSVDVRGDSGAGGANARAAADLRGNANRTSSGSTASIAGAAAVTPGLSGDREVDPEDVHTGDVSVLA